MSALNLTHRSRTPDLLPSPAPAVVMIHGWLGDENSMWAFENALPPNAVIVSPRAPFEAGNGCGWIKKGDGESFSAGLAALREFVLRLPEVYSVDPARIALIGFSQGAAMCYALALSDPQLANGVAALAGFLPEQARQWVAPNRLAGTPIFIAHGIDDTAVPIEDAIRARDAMILCGADVSYSEYPVGHKMNVQGMRDLEKWLKVLASG